MFILTGNGKIYVMTNSKPTSALGLKYLYIGVQRE